MRQSLKAMMVAGVAAMGLSVLTAPADAQPVPGQWNYLVMQNCSVGAVGGDVAGANTPLQVIAEAYGNGGYNYGVYFTVYGGLAVILSQFCEAGNSSRSPVFIYAFYNGPNNNPPWGPFDFWPSLNTGQF
jgi:hypothetical protein